MAMNPMGGIDQQITQRAARMKNDPNALMQQYGQSKNILDLIAAQRAAEKVQKEKQLAALQMQGNPPTVADQLEQTIVAAEKEKMAPDLAGMKNLRDRTKGVAGVLAQKQRQQQKRMQQMGQQPQRPPQQQPQQQRPQGQPTMAAAGGLMTQRAPNLERMYNGGIVGYNVGGGVYEPTQEEIEEERRRLISSNRVFERMSDEQIASRLRAQYEPKISRIPEADVREKRQELESSNRVFKRLNDDAIRSRIAAERGGVYEKLPPTMGLGEGVRREGGTKPSDIEMVTEEMTEQLDTGTPLAPVPVRSQKELSPFIAREAAAAAREPDVAAAAAAGQQPTPVETDEITMEQVVKMAGGASQAPATLRQAAPTSGAPVPDFLLNREEQGRRRIAEIGDNAMAAGISGLPTGPLKTLERGTQAPELLRRRPNTPLTLDQEYEALRRKQLAELKKDEAGLTDTRSNTRRLLDRLTDAAINASKRPAATSNRGALASFGLGISEAVRAEEKERKEGLAGIRERRNALLKAREDRELARAQISQGERGLDIQQQRASTTAEQVAGMLGINESRLKLDAEKLGMDAEQFAAELKQAGSQFDQSMAFKILDANTQNRYRKQTAELKGQELTLQREMLKAKTDAQKSNVKSKVVTAISEVNTNAQDAIDAATQSINISPTLNKQEKADKIAEATRTINADKQTLINALKGIGADSGLTLPAADVTTAPLTTSELVASAEVDLG